jgi:hypothetical protein
MIVVEASYAHVMWTVNFYHCQCHFLVEKCSDEGFIYFLFDTVRI